MDRVVIYRILEWIDKRCSLAGESLSKQQKEYVFFAFNQEVSNEESKYLNNLLLLNYRLGFSLELNGIKDQAPSKFNNPIDEKTDALCYKAYNMGRLDAALGDDNPSIDYIADEDILREIKK